MKKELDCLCVMCVRSRKQAKKKVYANYEKYSSVDIDGVRCMLEIVFKKLKKQDLEK